ncbi:MAG: prolipoprotein diacylglyceryl transferase [Anaerolineales bacterium]|jgi:prolipoprotein diacylglyceryl transferase
MLPILQIGPLAVQLPGLILLAGVWVGMMRLDRDAARNGIPPAHLNNLVFIGLVAGILGARLGYALRFWEIYLQDPLGLLSLNSSTLSLDMGLLVGILAAVIYGQRRQMPLGSTLDALAPSLAIFSIALGVSHLSSGDAFGRVTEVPWAIELWGASRQPSQVYEIALAGLIFVIVLRAGKASFSSGSTFTVWVALTALARLLIEPLRGDSVIILSDVREAQAVSLLLLLAALLVLHGLESQAVDENLNND